MNGFGYFHTYFFLVKQKKKKLKRTLQKYNTAEQAATLAELATDKGHNSRVVLALNISASKTWKKKHTQ